MNYLKAFTTFGATLGTLAALTIIMPARGFAQSTVYVVNPDVRPVPMKRVFVPGTQPFQYEFELAFATGVTAATPAPGSPLLLTVPAGKLLVVEYAGFLRDCPGDSSDTAWGLIVNNGKVNAPGMPAVWMPLGKASPLAYPAGIFTTASIPLHYHTSEYATIMAFATRGANGPGCSAKLTLTGYLEDITQ